MRLWNSCRTNESATERTCLGHIPKIHAIEGRYLETFLVRISWLEHLRQHKRVTNADRVLEDKVYSKLLGKPTVTHFIAAERGRGRKGD